MLAENHRRWDTDSPAGGAPADACCDSNHSRPVVDSNWRSTSPSRDSSSP